MLSIFLLQKSYLISTEFFLPKIMFRLSLHTPAFIARTLIGCFESTYLFTQIRAARSCYNWHFIFIAYNPNISFLNRKIYKYIYCAELKTKTIREWPWWLSSKSNNKLYQFPHFIIPTILALSTQHLMTLVCRS